MNVSRSLILFMRIAMAFQVILGIGFWTGNWSGLRGLHMAVGALFVLALWIIAGIAISQQRSAKLAAFAFVWGVIVIAVGMTQQQILVGDLHWIVRVVHLAIGFAAMPIAERLAAPAAARARARARAMA
jgi:hypothetical protein